MSRWEGYEDIGNTNIPLIEELGDREGAVVGGRRIDVLGDDGGGWSTGSAAVFTCPRPFSLFNLPRVQARVYLVTCHATFSLVSTHGPPSSRTDQQCCHRVTNASRHQRQRPFSVSTAHCPGHPPKSRVGRRVPFSSFDTFHFFLGAF